MQSAQNRRVKNCIMRQRLQSVLACACRYNLCVHFFGEGCFRVVLEYLMINCRYQRIKTRF
jgi:hypothetical protein